jgi:hypothetical protein
MKSPEMTEMADFFFTVASEIQGELNFAPAPFPSHSNAS